MTTAIHPLEWVFERKILRRGKACNINLPGAVYSNAVALIKRTATEKSTEDQGIAVRVQFRDETRTDPRMEIDLLDSFLNGKISRAGRSCDIGMACAIHSDTGGLVIVAAAQVGTIGVSVSKSEKCTLRNM